MKTTLLHKVVGLLLFALLSVQLNSIYAQSFSVSGLAGEISNNPTSIQFGPDGRLYVSQQDGTIYVYTIIRNAKDDYAVTDTETISIIKNMANHNDDGSMFNGNVQRQITGLLVKGTSETPILYVTSSDYRIGGGGGGSDIDLDTNSGIVSKLTKTNGGWNKVDLVRGLPRSEENHASNGMQFDENTNILYLAQGGHTNAGAPSNNFAFTTEYALSGAILVIDLSTIEAMPLKTDANTGDMYFYDLPTLDDPTRSNANGIEDTSVAGYDGIDVNDPFGGNDGLNQAKLVENGPVQIYASGFRNAYDLVITESGNMYTWDNGANGGWGGHPANEGVGTATNNWVVGEPGSTGPGPNDAQVNNKDGLHFISSQGYYGGHPNPIRNNPAGAGLFTHDSANGSGGENGVWRTAVTGDINTTLPVDWPPVPLSLANPVEGDFQNPGVDDSSLYTVTSSTNGITEYVSDNLNQAYKGNLLAASFNGTIYRVQLNAAGTISSSGDVTVFASNFGSVPLDVTALGANDIFPGTVWAATYGSDNITIFEPSDYDTPAGPKKEYNINCGGPQLEFNGVVWEADAHFLNGTSFFTTNPIENTEDDALYKTERYNENLAYAFPVVNGNYEVELHFADIYAGTHSVGARVFDGFIEGQLVLDDYDIFAEVGGFAAVVKTFEIEVVDDELNIDFTSLADNAKLSAITIRPVSPEGIRINAGGPEVTINGVIWLADIHFTNGMVYSTASDISNTNADVLYQTERWNENLAYAVPLDNGRYDVILHFADIYPGTQSVGARIFDASLEGNLVLDNYDIFADVGAYTASSKMFSVDVSDGTLNIDFTSTADNAKLSAIEIVLDPNICVAADDNTIDDDQDGFTNADEFDNNTDPCNGADMPPDFDGTLINGFKVSNLNDPDDDDDGIDDMTDFFAWDPSNGLNLTLPVEYPFLNGDPGYGFFGLGFTGLMTNYTSDYLELIKDETNSNTEIIAGGAVGLFTLNGVPNGDAVKTVNNQYNGFQFGVNVNSETDPFTFEAGLAGPIFSNPPNKYQSMGVFIGNGDQDNYLKVTIMANLGNPVVEIANESNGIFTSQKVSVQGIGDESELSLYLKVDPATGIVQAQYSIADGEPVNVGNPVTLSGPSLEALQNTNQALAVGVISTTYASDPDFNATWDYFNILIDETPVEPSDLVVPESVLVSEVEIIALENANGNQNIVVESIEFNGSDNFTFKLYDALPITLTPGEIREFIEVSYSGIGGENATITINHDGANGPATEIQLTTNEVSLDILGETGQAVIDGNWKQVVFNNAYVDPVVVVSDLGLEDAAPAVVRVRNVTPTGFELKVQEWKCMDQTHGESLVSYIVVESGIHELPNGGIVQAVNSYGINHNWVSSDFSTKFQSTPVLVSQATTYNGSDPITVRIDDKTIDGFRMKVQEDEGADGSHTTETVSWIAMTYGSYDAGLLYEAKGTPGIAHNLEPISFDQAYEEAPIFIGKMSSYFGGNTAVLRYDQLTLSTTGVEVQIQEEQCFDTELGHVDENVNYFVFNQVGVLYGTLEMEPVCTDADISLDIVLTNASCGEANGSIDVTSSCLLLDCQVSYVWSHGATTEDLADLAPGTYTVTATINGGCSAIETIVIEEDCIVNGTDVWLEAECAEVGSNWTEYDNSLASGGKFLAPPNAYSYNSAPTGTSDIISFNFSVSEAGNYKVYARAYATDSGSDSFWVRANGRSWVKWNLVNYPYTDTSDFSWDRVSLWEGGSYVTPVVFALDAGENTIDFSWREPNALLDKIFITLTGNEPTGLGEIATNCDSNVSEVTQLSTETNLSQTILYPNPTSGVVNIEFVQEVNSFVDVEVYDSFGRLVQTEYFEMVESKITFDLSSLVNGVYLIRLTSPAGYYETQRVEVNR